MKRVNHLPVLIIAFNRFEITKELFSSIREFSPSEIYYSIDGPRIGNSEDKITNNKLRNLISTVDWPCRIETLFSEINKGSGIWPYESISWALAQTPRLLILEDDVRISKTFYDLSKYCLDKFEDNKRIFAICASNIIDLHGDSESMMVNSSKYFSGWGWSTWADRWETYEFDIKKKNLLSFLTLLKSNNYNLFISLYFWLNFFKIKNNLLQAWDYQINYLLFTSQKLILKPDRNLSINLGTGNSATHTKSLPKINFNQELSIEKNFKVNLELDYRKEKLWRKSRLRFLIKSILLRFI